MVRDDDQDMAGRDDLSGAGRFLAGGGEEPPPALDAVILQAAQEALREEQTRPSRRRLLWPLAASVLLSTTALLMFGPDAPQRESAALVSEEGLRPRTFEAAGSSGEALPRTVSGEAPPSAPAPLAPRRAPASSAAEAQAVQESGLPEEAIAGSGFRIRQLPPEAEPLQEAEPVEVLEEIAVTGSRVRLAEPGALPSAPADYSEDPDLWRAAIRLLLEAGLVELAREEREQFLQRYPELDPGPWVEAVEGSQKP